MGIVATRDDVNGDTGDMKPDSCIGRRGQVVRGGGKGETTS